MTFRKFKRVDADHIINEIWINDRYVTSFGPSGEHRAWINVGGQHFTIVGSAEDTASYLNGEGD